MTPSIGRIVGYTLTERDAEQINKRRKDAETHDFGRIANDGRQIHYGNVAREGDILPMLIVRVWSIDETAKDTDLVNGKVELDGNDVLWVTSSAQAQSEIGATDNATAPGKWHQLPRV